MSRTRRIRIGGASGFWGDSEIATPQLLSRGDVDYLVYDYLAEITMSIMARARASDPDAGYATHFVRTVASQLAQIAERKVRILSNAGGVNPVRCAEAIREAVADAGLDLRVAVVTGDDLLPQEQELRAGGMREMRTGESLPDKPWSINAYLGAGAIRLALEAGADIVVTGRCVDSALTLGACMHEFGWGETDYDLLAAGSLAGHILECGAQASGGLHTDWEATGDWSDIGYPIVDIDASGVFSVTKPEDTGGLVSRGTVAEQLVYEIGDPRRYILPDVVCDFADVAIVETGPNVVEVRGAKGAPPPDAYKVSATWQDGYRVGMYLTIGGIDAVRKAEKVAADVLRRCGRMLGAAGLGPFSRTSVEVLGSEASYGPHGKARDTREVVLKVAAAHRSKAALTTLVQELTSSGTSMAPGITGMGGNRPTVSPVVRLFSCLVAKERLSIVMEIDGRKTTYVAPPALPARPPRETTDGRPVDGVPLAAGDHVVRLVDLAFGRSGDKGNDANVGIIARRPEYLPYIREQLTEEKVAAWFAHLGPSNVRRFDLPGIFAVNFVLSDVLDGGGIASLRNDPQGKAYAQMLLDHPIRVPSRLIADPQG